MYFNLIGKKIKILSCFRIDIKYRKNADEGEERGRGEEGGLPATKVVYPDINIIKYKGKIRVYTLG